MFSPLGFRFDCDLLPNIGDWIQRVDIPSIGVSSGAAKLQTPFASINTGGDHLDYGNLFVDFKLDENFENYKEIYRWLVAKGRPTSSDTYAEWLREYGKIKTDIVVTLLNSKFNPVGKWTYIDAAPTQMSNFSVHTDAENVDYVSCTVEFAFTLGTFTAQ
jgi:hypothetical protein